MARDLADPWYLDRPIIFCAARPQPTPRLDTRCLLANLGLDECGLIFGEAKALHRFAPLSTCLGGPNRGKSDTRHTVALRRSPTLAAFTPIRRARANTPARVRPSRAATSVVVRVFGMA